MPRQSITLSDPNYNWITQKIKSKEFRSNSEVVNDALRKAREMENGVETIRQALIEGEKNGVSNRTPDDIIKAVLKKRHLNDTL